MMGDNEDMQHTVTDTGVPEPVEQPEWVVTKSLLDVENTCTNTIEAFLLYTTTDRVDDLPTEELEARIDELIAKQERTIAEMELAKQALTDLETE